MFPKDNHPMQAVVNRDLRHTEQGTVSRRQVWKRPLMQELILPGSVTVGAK